MCECGNTTEKFSHTSQTMPKKVTCDKCNRVMDRNFKEERPSVVIDSIAGGEYRSDLPYVKLFVP